MPSDIGLAQACSNKNKAHVGTGQIRKHPLDIDLSDRDQTAPNRTAEPDRQHHRHRQGRQTQQRLKANQHPSARCDHHRIAQNRRRHRPFHRFIKPTVQRKLGTFRDRGRKQS